MPPCTERAPERSLRILEARACARLWETLPAGENAPLTRVDVCRFIERGEEESRGEVGEGEGGIMLEFAVQGSAGWWCYTSKAGVSSFGTRTW